MFLQQRLTFSFLPAIVFIIALLPSCTVVVKNYPKNKPFVFSNKITVEGIPSKDEKKRLQTELVNYWEDSLKAKSITKFGIRTVIKSPPVFDSANVVRSMVFMNSYLNSQGYYNAVLRDSIDTIIKGSQQRVNVMMNVELGKNLHIDSIAYDLTTPELQKITLANTGETFLEKNKPFSKQIIASELDRLVTLYRKNGYFKFTRDNLFADVDTTDVSLLELSLDPFEQAQKIAEATRKRRLNPSVTVIIRQRNSADSGSFTKFSVGRIYYYPETNSEIPDSLIDKDFKSVFTKNKITSKQNTPIIHWQPLYEHTYMRRDSTYDEAGYFKTVNALSQMGAWSQVDVRTRERKDSISRLDFHFFLTPAKKYSFSSDFEVSRNTGTISAGNLLGIANNTTIRNRNVWKESIQSNTALRTGIELSFTDTALQTFQASISQTYSIPKVIAPAYFRKRLKRLDSYKTLVNFSAGYTERRNYYRLRTIVGSWGYEWKRKTNLYTYRPLNVELYTLDTLPGLVDAFNKNAFLRTAFNTGYVVSQNISYNKIFPGTKNSGVTNYIRLFGEEAGFLVGKILGVNEVYEYVKAEAEFRQLRQFRKTAFAYRLFGGIGYNYSNDAKIGQSLPFFKQFVAGGPNSMRAWNIRQLGLGSSLLSDTSSSFRDRFGDIQIETNFEYRFPVTVISGVKINSALFTDIGNIWNLKNNIDNPGSKLSFHNFLKDLAIGAGTGVRIDFNYFLVRVDFALKLKDPARIENNGWLNLADFTWRNYEGERKDTNGNLLSPRRNNYAIQLGIGLPF